MAELLIQGVAAVMAPAGFPFDVLAYVDKKPVRIQVKSTGSPWREGLYRFHLRAGRGGDRRVSAADVDVVAFVALDSRQIAFFASGALVSDSGHFKTCIELRKDEHGGRVYPNGTVRRINWGRMFPGHPFSEAIAGLCRVQA